jgi:DNA-binding PadR family transcriptional regulator
MYRVLLALRSSDQQASDILDGLRAAGGETPSLAAFYRSLKNAIDDGWLEIAGNDASGPGRPRQIYHLTPFGRRALDKEARRLQALASLAFG